MDQQQKATDYIAEMYCKRYNLKYEGTREELFKLFNIDEFHDFHNRYYKLILESVV